MCILYCLIVLKRMKWNLRQSSDFVVCCFVMFDCQVHLSASLFYGVRSQQQQRRRTELMFASDENDCLDIITSTDFREYKLLPWVQFFAGIFAVQSFCIQCNGLAGQIRYKRKQYTVSQKTSHLWLAITLTYMNGFWYFSAEMLPIMYAIKRRFTMPP